MNTKSTSLPMIAAPNGRKWWRSLLMVVWTCAAAGALGAADATPVLQIEADQVAARVSPLHYGLMTEEINYCYDGGLYAELIINRTFKENAQSPVWWHLIQDGGGIGSMSLDTNQPLNEALITCEE